MSGTRQIVTRTTLYHYGCPVCHQCGGLETEPARADAIAGHARSCRGVVGLWTDRREVWAPNLDDTSGCPKFEACEVCAGTFDVMTLTVGTRVGVSCIRVCLYCADPGGPPPFDSRTEAVERVNAHCDHLGITSAEMRAVLDAETWHGKGDSR